jgi:hypothetical protein
VKALVALALAAAALLACAREDPEIRKARDFFERYVDLYDAFDPQVVGLYSDQVRAINLRRYENGAERQMELEGARYKELLAKSLPLARERGDRGTYSDVTFAIEGEYVRISAMRFSQIKGYALPLTLRVGPIAAQDWRIVEERSESRAHAGETPAD